MASGCGDNLIRRIGCGRGLLSRDGVNGTGEVVGTEWGGLYGGGFWKKISLDGATWYNCVKWNLGRGNNILFWLDDWVDGDVSRITFLEFTQLLRIKLFPWSSSVVVWGMVEGGIWW